MANSTYPELLRSNGWTEAATPSFAEKAGAGADTYFSYQNRKANHLALAVFLEDQRIRFRVFDPATREVAWLQIEIDADVDKVIAEIVAQQEAIAQEETFGFYFQISALGDVSILAWEQFEDDYR